MISQKKFRGVVLFVLASVLLSLAVAAENSRNAAPRRSAAENTRTSRTYPTLDYDAMIQRRIQRKQQEWKIPNAQWTVIEPILSKVMSLRTSLTPSANYRNRALSTGIVKPGEPTGDRFRSGLDEKDIGNPNEKIKTAFEALLQVTRDSKSTQEQISEKIKAYQTIRQQVQNELDEASKQLCELLTARQRAQLVIEGTLE